ncbi:hypothetical protein ACIBI9_53810 [Nonomuraea sp. NPDC050451]|uniref:hypothetical protein n=1 Tax=Nonomuraea sp. NPDC050451 TaxID=3364364 RepID=UPI00379CE7DD
MGRLYEAKVTSSTPQTVRYGITSGQLPDGLVLNKDAGAITGIPPGPEPVSSPSPPATATWSPTRPSLARCKVTPIPASPQIVLTAKAGRDTLARGKSAEITVSARNDSSNSVSCSSSSGSGTTSSCR